MNYLFVVKVEAAGAAFADWAEEAGYTITDMNDREGCPFPVKTLFEVIVPNADGEIFADDWKNYIVSMGVTR